MTTTIGTQPHPILLAGRWVESPDVLTVSNPADPGNPAGRTYQATAEQYDQAVEAAVAAFEQTRQMPAYERGRILRTISAGIKARREELGQLIAREAGKPIRDALVEVDRAVLTFRLGAEEAERMVGEIIPLDLMASSRGRVGITRRFPVGPVAAISPFNFPLNLAAHKLSPAIAAGCSIVLKPPSQGPAHDAHRGRDHRRGGSARRVPCRILPMTRELGDRMVADDRFKLLTFTGSPSVGWRMKERAGKKKVVLELGGNAGVIVDRTRGPRLGGQALPGRGLRLCRPGLHQRPADVRSTRTSGTSSWTASSAGAARAQGGRPARSRRPTSVRWSTTHAAARTQRWVDEALAPGGKLLLGRQGRRHVLPADDPDRCPGDRAGLLERGLRAARRGLPVP